MTNKIDSEMSRKRVMAGSPAIPVDDPENWWFKANEQGYINRAYYRGDITPAHLEAKTTFNPYEIRCTEPIPVDAEKL